MWHFKNSLWFYIKFVLAGFASTVVAMLFLVRIFSLEHGPFGYYLLFGLDRTPPWVSNFVPLFVFPIYLLMVLLPVSRRRFVEHKILFLFSFLLFYLGFLLVHLGIFLIISMSLKNANFL